MPSPLSARLSAACLAFLLLSLSAAIHAQTWISTPRSADTDEDRLETALRQRGSIDFVDAPLKDVAQSLSQQFGVPIILFAKKLEEASVSPDTPITKQLDNLPLESTLRLLLKNLELGFTIRDNVIVITTPEDIQSMLVTRVYPVLDLVARSVASDKDGKTVTYADYDSLIEVITSTLKPDSWDDVGGPGGIDCLDNAAALVVSQTRDVHRQIDGLLLALRRAKTVQGIPSITFQPRDRESASVPGAISRVTPAAALPPWQSPHIHTAANQ